MRTHFIVSLSLIIFTGCYGSYQPAGMTGDGSEPELGTAAGGNTAQTPVVDNDQDDDGHDSVDSGGDDCVDTDPTIHPGATEADGCDGIDSDCDGEDRGTNPNARTGAPGASDCDGVDMDGDHFLDVDGDGNVVDCDDNVTTGVDTFPGAAELESSSLCMEDADEDGYGNMTPSANVTAGTDCDDAEPIAFPGNPEDCDGIDNDCSGTVDDKDADEDGHVDDTCTAYTGLDPIDDCDDTDEEINPDVLEISNDGIDQDCDGSDLVTADPDSDNDGSIDSDDCDDTDPLIHPGATEVVNDGIDQDCDGFDRIDVDCDGADAIVDCDDEDPERSPQFTEILNDGIDNDCDPATLDAAADPDSDGDGTVDSLDCDDTDADINPGATEVADDGIDQDCDGSDLVTVVNDECEPGFRRVNTIFTAPAGSTINWMSLWILIDTEEVEDSNVLETPPTDVTAEAISNVGTIAYDRCVPDSAPWSLNAEFVDLSGATHWMCENATVTGLQVFANGVDITADITADVWDGHSGCDAAF